MSVIDGVIAEQSFELVRDRIGEILADEIDNQAEIDYEPDLELDVYAERFVAFKHTEVPAINVMLARGELGGHSAVQSDGTYRYNIDCYTAAKSSDGVRGDSMAMMKLQRLLGVCRAILEDPKYKRLGFTPPFIMRRYVESISIADPDSKDAASVVMGRLSFVVKVPENVNLIVPELVAGMDTVWKLALTEKGYMYKMDQRTFDETFDETFK